MLPFLFPPPNSPESSHNSPSSQVERPPRPTTPPAASRRLGGAPPARLAPHANPQPEPGARRRAVGRACPLPPLPALPHAKHRLLHPISSNLPLARAGWAACRSCAPAAATSGRTSATRTSTPAQDAAAARLPRPQAAPPLRRAPAPVRTALEYPASPSPPPRSARASRATTDASWSQGSEKISRDVTHSPRATGAVSVRVRLVNT